MRKIVLLATAFALALSVAGCLTPAADGGGEEESVPSPAENMAEDEIKIEDVQWSVEPGVYDGDSMMVFSYTNNSKYPILSMRVEFQQKEGVTDEQRAVFNSLYDDGSTWGDINGGKDEVYVGALRDRYVEPGESCDIPCTFNFTAYPVTDAAQFELMEPKMMTIAYKANDKVYAEYYDFAFQSYSLDSDSGAEAVQWSDSAIAGMLPKLEQPVVVVSSDREDYFYARSYGASAEAFDSYVSQVQEKGFTEGANEGTVSFDASNAEGYEVHVGYYPPEEALYVYVNAPTQDSGAA